MANRILNLIFKADTVQAKAAIDGLAGKEGQPGGVAGLNLNMLALGGAAFGAFELIKNQISDMVDASIEVDNLAKAFGITTEEAGILYDAMQDYDISEAPIKKGFETLVDEGIDPTVKGLGDILDQWSDMPAGAEKAAFAAENFGNTGIGPLLTWFESLTDEEQEHLELLEDTQEYLDPEDALAYKDAVNDLEEAFGGFKVALAEDVIPALADVLDFITRGVVAGGQLVEILGVLGDRRSARRAEQTTTYGEYMAGLPGAAGGGFGSYVASGGLRGHATGGSFIVGGQGGSDTTPVSFMATPGETVNIGGGTNDMENILAEMRRLVDGLPTALIDAMERK